MMAPTEPLACDGCHAPLVEPGPRVKFWWRIQATMHFRAAAGGGPPVGMGGQVTLYFCSPVCMQMAAEEFAKRSHIP